MKKVFLLLSTAFISVGTMAQNSYDAYNIMSSDLNGTARYVGMGGALSALGGDISVISNNPAGSATFRKSDAAITIGGVFADKGVLDNDRSRASIDNAGVVISMPTDDSYLKYINFGVNYHKKKNFLSNLYTEVGNIDGLSQTIQIADMANLSDYNDSWGDLPYNAVQLQNDINEYNSLCNYDDASSAYYGAPAQYADMYKSQRGSTSQTDFNVSFNVLDKYFFGVSMGVYNMNYTRESNYFEAGADGVANYYISNYYDSKGDGYDAKFGFICRPIDNSPFRFGLTVHTPTWYKMDDYHGCDIVMMNTDETHNTFYSDGARQYYAPSGEYSFRTPWKFGVSLGYTEGNYFAIGAEYEYQDLSSSKFYECEYYDDNYYAIQNAFIKDNLKGQSVFKIGMEAKPDPSFSIRAGYNYVSAPFKSNAYNSLQFDMNLTETDFTNWKDTHRFTFGLGYRFKGGYVDLAYQYQTQKGDFYAFDHVDLKPTEISNNRSQLMCTLGFKF